MNKYLSFFVCFLFLGCTVRYVAELDEMPSTVAIVGQITDTLSCHEIRLTRTVPYYSKVVDDGISDALVQVETSDSNVYIFREDSLVQGLYKSEVPFAGHVGVEYRLFVELDSNMDGVWETYKASSVMQPHLPIDSLKFSCKELLNYHIYPLTVYMAKPFSQEYLLVNYVLNGIPVTSEINQWLTFDSKLLDWDRQKGVNLITTSVINTLMDESDRTKCSNNEEKHPIFVKTGDSITVLFSRIEEGFYNFIKQCKAINVVENPIWGGNNANITTNFTGGVLGYFSTRSIVKTKSVIR